MKITKKHLQKIIKEEIQKLVHESAVFGFDVDLGSKQMAEVTRDILQSYALGKPLAASAVGRDTAAFGADKISEALGEEANLFDQVSSHLDYAELGAPAWREKYGKGIPAAQNATKMLRDPRGED
jgi:hypothetical protein